MQMIYDSESFVVVRFAAAEGGISHDGYEIVDKQARRGLFIDGVVAEGFSAGVQALADREPTVDDYDEFIAGYTQLALQPVVMH